tara:strand:- start:861 stop:2057 length:1197 start_codon:yes stop_codon:yes gene_type:complete
MELNKTSFVEINKNKKPIVLFGSGNIAKKNIRKIGKAKIAFIVDNSTDLQGTKYEGFEIYSPKIISKDNFVIICSTAISSISNQLLNSGLLENKDFVISPILNDLLAISELEQLNLEFYFTSGTVPDNNSDYGGGLYKCKVLGSEINLKKLYSGPCYGLIKKDDSLLFIDTDNGLFSYKKGKINKLCKLPKGARAHGISFNDSNKMFYITCSDLDLVLELDSNYKIIREFPLSFKRRKLKEPMHNCNDNLSIENSLFVSMFSSTGNWKNDVFDGCIAEFNIESGERLNDIKSGLYMPHNLKFFDGSIHVLDSLPGHLLFNNLSVQGTFPGFSRGLDYNSGLYFIGQSKNRNYSKVLGLSNNISIDCGIIIFNPTQKVSRFIPLSMQIGEIHSIISNDS